MKTFLQLKRNLKKSYKNLTNLNVGIISDSSSQLLSIAIKAHALDYGFNLNIFEADYNQVDSQILNQESDLYISNPEIIILHLSTNALLEKYNHQKSNHVNFAEDILELIDSYYNSINSNSDADLIFYNFPEINDSIYGNFSNKFEGSFLFQLRKLNFLIIDKYKNNTDFLICDISTIQNQIGKQIFFNNREYVNSSMVFSIESIPNVAKFTVDIISSIKGVINKCLILDLDNTLWGGVIGDDGIENIKIGGYGVGKSYYNFQKWIKKLKNRGVILAVCSKNTDNIAREPFLNHPEMVLTIDDISVFVANWDDKVNNIIKIKNILNIGYDSMIFLDDNPFERNLVRENIKEIKVPELPKNPEDYLDYLCSINLFETNVISKEDKKRTIMYQNEATRSESKNQFSDLNEYLESLNMKSKIDLFNSFNIARISQLSQRSNQFNLRTIRYTEDEVLSLSKSNNHFCFSYSLEDKFGHNGIISVVIIEKLNKALFIDTWLMSCRVLKRGMELFILNNIVEIAKKNNFDTILGEFIPTKKNVIVKNHYKDLGFKKGKYWELNVKNFTPKKCFIQKKIDINE